MEKSLDLCSNFQLQRCLYGRHLHEDRISYLSDDVLLLILSSLSFKEVVRTSLLSRRWLNLWVHAPVLDIPAPVTKSSLIDDMERRNYIEWVNRVLRRHEFPYLKEFKIVCQLDMCSQKDIESWLVFAFSKKVERLELNLLIAGYYAAKLSNNYVVPGWFLDFNNRKAISGGGMSRFLQFDSKCLKSLSLKRVDVTGEAINLFLLNYPFLEQLEVVGTLKLDNLVISHPNLVLKHLKIESCYNLNVLSISNFNLVSLEIPSVYGLILTNLPFLVELSIRGTSESLSRSLSQASSCFSKLEALTLVGLRLKDASHLSNIDQLTKLKRLVIEIGAPSDESLTMFISIINSCPQLEEFVLTFTWFSSNWTSTRTIKKVERRGSSPLKSKSLKIFEFFVYFGCDRDVELIMQVAENALGLEKIIIDLTGRSISTNSREEEEAARNIALQEFDSLRKSIPPHVHLLIR